MPNQSRNGKTKKKKPPLKQTPNANGVTTSDEGDVNIPNGNDNHGPGEICGRREAGGGLVVEAGETRSERNAGEIVLNEAVDVDDGGGVAELNASDEHEDESDDGVDRFEHLTFATFPRRHGTVG